jgi:hypothetical protein
MKWVQHLFTFKETPREKAGNSQRVPYRQGYYGLVKTLVRFERWPAILDGRTIPVYDKPEQQAWRLWAVGLAQAGTGKSKDARTTLAELQKQVAASTGTGEPLRIAAIELEATIAARSGDRRKANELFARAADRESRMIYTEPPSYPRPVVEGWANTALATRDFATAERQYREALKREPGSGRAFFGLSAALRGQNKMTESREAHERGAKAWAKADADLPQLQTVRSTAGQ